MKFIQILFGQPMIKPIKSGKKKQTRRAVKGDALKWLSGRDFPPEITDPIFKLCPFGQPGDVLWAREAWGKIDDVIVYKADDPTLNEFINLKWKPGIHMKKEYCRTFLRIKSIRIERYLDITEKDAIAEGIEKIREVQKSDFQYKWKDYLEVEAYKGQFENNLMTGCEYPVQSFMSLWSSIYGAGAKSENPWLWVIEFERIDRPEGFLNDNNIALETTNSISI